MAQTEQKYIAEESGYVVSSLEGHYDGRNGPEIDLGLGTSPIGPAPELRPRLAERDPFEVLSRYAPDPLHTATRKIVAGGLGLPEERYTSVLFNDNGSYGGGDEVVRFTTLKGYGTVLVPNLSFPNVAQWCARHNAEYIPVNTGKLTPTASLEQVLTLDDDVLSGSVVYIDYPNNPFGLYEPQLMRDVVAHASRHGAIPLVDLAFGEVMGEEYREAIQYTLEHQGVCIGSLSKTQGLPGLRTGYAILPDLFTSDGYSGPQRLVFGLNNEAEFVYQELFRENGSGISLARVHAARVAAYNRETNEQLYRALQDLGLCIGPTSLATPIQVIMSELPDLYQRLRREGLLTESLADYSVTIDGREGLGHSAVRMLTPSPGQLDEVIRRCQLAVSSS